MHDSVGAIVIGGHYQGLGVIRALATRGVHVVLVDHEPCMARFSKYVHAFYRCPNPRDEEAFFLFLQRLADRGGVNGWVIFPTDDETVFFLARHRAQLEEMYRVTTPEWDVIKFAYNKKESYRLAERLNIPIPKTFCPEKEEDLSGCNVAFPVLVKPAVMRDFFRVTGKKVFRAKNPNELVILYRKACTIIKPDEILIQEEVPDVAKNLYSFCPMYKNKKVLARITAKRSRQHPMDFGHASTFVETVDIPELEVLGNRFLSAINYYGLCEVEFIQDPRDEEYKFLEVNPRIWGWHTLAIRAGVNLPYWVYRDMLGYSCTNGYYQKGVKWIRLTTDVPTVVKEIAKRKMTLGEYIRTLHGEKEFAVFSLRDPLPFLGELFMLPYLMRKRGF